MTTINDILAMEIQGNAFSDAPLFKAVDIFLRSEASDDDKVLALAKQDEAMGIQPATTIEEVNQYLEECDETYPYLDIDF